jgi:Flp pilus assembly protein TadD
MVAFLICSGTWARIHDLPAAELWPSSETKKSAVESLPPKESAEACRTTADMLAQHGHLEAAVGLYQRARQLNDKQSKVARQLAVLYDQLQMDDKALIEYRRALDEHPKDAELWNDLGYFYLSRGDANRAEGWFRQALQIHPKHQKCQGNLAIALAEQSRYEEAFTVFESLVGPAAAHSNLGVVMARQGKTREAIQSFRKALELDGTLEPARSTLAHLERTP